MPQDAVLLLALGTVLAALGCRSSPAGVGGSAFGSAAGGSTGTAQSATDGGVPIGGGISASAARPPTLAAYWQTNAFGQPAAKWRFDRVVGTNTADNHIVIGPPGRCAGGVSPWWDVYRGGQTTAQHCPANLAGQGTQIALSCDQGKSWQPAAPLVVAEAGQPWACFATDGRLFYDSQLKLWHFLFQCLGEDGLWNGCHLVNASDPDQPTWTLGPGQPANPVIFGQSDGGWDTLWRDICLPGTRCGAETSVSQAGTFDIIEKDDAGYFWIDFHGYGASTNLYRGIARTADFVTYEAGGVGGTPADSIYDVQTQSYPGNDDVNETWDRYSAGGAGTIVKDGPSGAYYFVVENIDNQSDLSDPNTDPAADKKWDVSLGRQTTLGASDWDWASLPQGNPIFLSAFDAVTGQYPDWMGGSDCYPYLFFDPAAAVWHLMLCREELSSVNGSATVLYDLASSYNALPDGDFNTRPGTNGTGAWTALAAAQGAVHMAVYRLPYLSSDGQQYLEANTTVPEGSVYEDTSDVRALAKLPVTFGGKVRGASSGQTGTLAVFEFDQGAQLLGQFALPFVTSDAGWQSVAYLDGGAWDPALARLRFQIYMDDVNVNYDFDELYLNAP